MLGDPPFPIQGDYPVGCKVQEGRRMHGVGLKGCYTGFVCRI